MLPLTPRARQSGLTAAVIAWAVLLSLALGWIARRMDVAPVEAVVAHPQGPVAP
jgi:hypothetical protein